MEDSLHIKNSDIYKIFLINELKTHVFFGLPLYAIMIIAWGIPISGLLKLGLYYFSIILFFYQPFFYLLARYLLYPINNEINKLKSQTLNSSDSQKVVEHLFSIPTRITLILFTSIYSAYLGSAFIFSLGIIPEFLKDINAVLFSTLAMGLVITITETMLNYLELMLYANSKSEKILQNFNDTLPIKINIPKRDSIRKRTLLLYFMASFCTTVSLMTFFLGNVSINQPDQLLKSVIFTLFAMVINISYIILISNAFTESIIKPIKALEAWAKKVTYGNYKEKIIYTTNDEMMDIIKYSNEMVDKIVIDQETLRNERNRFVRVIETLKDGIIVYKDNGAITQINSAAQKILEFDGDYRLTTLSMNMLLQCENTENNTKIPVSEISYKNHTSTKCYVITKQNNKKLVSITTQKIPIEKNQDLWVMSIHDLSPEEELEKLKMEFVSIAAHEFRSPITAARSYISVVQEESESILNEESKEYISKAMQSIDRLETLMEILLTTARIDHNTITIDKKPVVWEKVLRDTIDKYTNSAKEKNISINIDVPETVLPMVNIDESYMKEVINNLIENAIKYSEKGIIEVSARYNKQLHTLTTSVKDNGIGMPADVDGKLFTKFYRASNVIKNGIKGTGLGLYITKTIIELHGGKIWYQSKEGEGTTFTFTLHVE